MRIPGVGLVLVLLLVPVPAVAQVSIQATASPSAAFDEAGVRAAVGQRMAGRQQRDARLAAEPFAEDAVWINAFGTRLAGRAAIEAFLAGLYADPGFIQRETLEDEIREIVFLRPDVAVARTFQRSRGQRLPDGTVIAERRSHNTMTLTREASGWRVRYEIVTDERDRAAVAP
jgi:uncharacterized protein (TIGR02246 family)